MTPPKPQPGNLVSLCKAGLDPELVRAQMEKVQHSKTFEHQGNPQALLKCLVQHSLANDTAPTLEETYRCMEKVYTRGDSLIRNIANKLRPMLDDYYATEAKRGEIRLALPEREYIVYTPRPRRVRAVSTNELHGLIGRVDVRITEPAEAAEVYREVPVRGRIDALDPDLRLWLVVYANKGHFLQGRVSRRSPEWEQEVRCGIGPFGAAEGTEFIIMLVAADSDGDYTMYGHLKNHGPGWGMATLPADTWVLAKRRVIRRDLRDPSA